MKALILLLCLLLTGCGGSETAPTVETTIPETTAAIPETMPPETLPPDPIRLMLNDMSLEQRVGQLFLARCDDTYALEHLNTYHLGGFVLFGREVCTARSPKCADCPLSHICKEKPNLK